MAEGSPRRAGIWRRVAIGAAGVAVAAIVVLLLTGAGGAGDADPDADVTAISFERFDGGQASIGDYDGTPLVVNFFGSWCRPCVQEMPGLERVHEKYGDQVAFLGLNVNDPIAEGRKVARRAKVTYDLGRDPTGEILQAVGGEVMPVTVLVDPDGKIVALHNGEISPSELEGLIRGKLLT